MLVDPPEHKAFGRRVDQSAEGQIWCRFGGSLWRTGTALFNRGLHIRAERGLLKQHFDVIDLRASHHGSVQQVQARGCQVGAVVTVGSEQQLLHDLCSLQQRHTQHRRQWQAFR